MNILFFDSTLVFKTHERFEQIDIGSILFCKSEGSYIQFYLDDGRTIRICGTIKMVEKQLPAGKFLRIHRSLLLNLSKVSAFSSRRRLVQINNHFFKVSKRKYGDVLIELLRNRIPDKKIVRLKNKLNGF
jgi:two-component system LytT family response regulator